MPFYGITILAMAIIAAFPQIVLVIPNLIGM